MKTAVIYMSKHGTAEKAAALIAKKQNSGETEVINLRKDKLPSLEQEFDRLQAALQEYRRRHPVVRRPE